MTRPADLPEFANPPVVEVVLGIQFNPLFAFRSIHAWPLWQRFESTFPFIEEHAPLDPAFETFGPRALASAPLRFEIAPAPFVSRYWFLNKLKTELIQFQRDRFVHNWRKAGTGAEYPRYENIKRRFLDEILQLKAFLDDHALGELGPNQCEVTYVNHIRLPDDANAHENLGKILRYWNDLDDQGQTEGASLIARYAIRAGDDSPIGRLTVSAEPAFLPDNTPIITLTLMARGKPQAANVEAATAFFDVGRDRIVRTFARVTTTEMHRIWGLTK